MPNLRDICLMPIKIKGKFITKIKTDKFQSNNLESNSDMPVTPPSNNSFGTKKHSKPMLALKTPIPINRVSFILLKRSDLSCLFLIIATFDYKYNLFG